MKKMKKILILLMVFLLTFSTFFITASAYTEPATLLGVDINLEVGTYSGSVFTPLAPGTALHTNDVITVRIAPTTDFLCGISRYVVMFTTNYFEVVGSGKAAFTPNTDNAFYNTTVSDYSGQTTAFPQANWPAALVSNGAYAANSTVAVANAASSSSPNSGYPTHIPGGWLFRFNLRVKANVPAGSGAKVWMDSRWCRTPTYSGGQEYFYKCLDSTKLSSNGSASYNFNIDLADANVNLEPTANANITFNANGGTGGTGPTSMTPGAALTAPTVTRTGYTFSSWSPAVPPSVPAVDTTYTAQWTANTYTVTYNGNTSTSGSTANSSHTYDVSSGLASNGFAKIGNTFLGWSTSSSAITPTYSNGQSVLNLTSTPNDIITFYAVWSINSYNLTYDANGGTGGTGPTSTPYGSALTAPTVTRSGYTFSSWSPSVPPTMPAADSTYTAQWSINSYNLTYDANGGTGGTGPVSTQYNSALSAPTVTRTGYTFTGWSPSVPANMPAADATYTAQWSLNSYIITFNAGGGTGGTSALLAYGAPLTAPTVHRLGYTFTGWSPTVPSTVPAQDTTYTAQWEAVATYTITFNAGNHGLIAGSAEQTIVLNQGETIIIPRVTAEKGWGFTGWNTEPPLTAMADGTYTAQYTHTDVTLTKNLTDFTVNIAGWQPDYSYQIWSYQKVTSDIFPNAANDVSANQWILSKAYAKGSTGAVQADGSINFSIANFTSPDVNYTVAVRIVDENGNFVCSLRDTYTPAEVQAAEITKVLVDGQYSTGTEIKEIKSGASVLVKVIGNLPDLTYTATILDTMEQIPVSNTNEFAWDISSLAPRNYTIRVTASNGTSTDSKDIAFQLYSSAADVQYGVINSMSIGTTTSTLPQTVEINPNFSNGNFYYVVREPGRAPVYVSDQYPASGPMEYSAAQYGIYQVAGYVNRPYINPLEDSYDDGIFRTLTIKRSQVLPSTETLTSSVEIRDTPVAKGTNILFTANASIGGIGDTPVQYSFWRYDAQGYVLVKDWSSDNTLSWTPGRVGNYVIEARAKGEDAGSYEVTKSVYVDVTDTADQIAQGVVITLNQTELNANARARTPITIEASATNTNGDDLLYKFNVSDSFINAETIQQYSANQNCIWTPRKAGTYTISVLVKNKVSFGQFDAIKTFTVKVS